MKNKDIVIYELAAKGTLAEEPETKDLIFRTIISVITGQYDYLHVETENIKVRDDLTTENILKEAHFQQKGYVRLSTQKEVNEAKNKYSTYKGYPKLQLALDFFQMSNDLFFMVYGFNYVPEGNVRKAARSMIDNSHWMNTVYLNQGQRNGKSVMMDAMSPGLNIDMNNIKLDEILKPMRNNTFKPGC
ncbi:MAG: hypothetical protein JJU16_05255 [Alkalibacterium sp.]|nr:hypothetical protein [Alkalibacterium sp.]